MLTSLDLLVIAFMALAALSLLSLCLMFLVKNKIVKRVCFYVVAVLGVYAASIAIRMGLGLFMDKLVLGILTGLMSVAAVVLDLLSKKYPKLSLIARILAAVALVVGFLNAIL